MNIRVQFAILVGLLLIMPSTAAGLSEVGEDKNCMKADDRHKSSWPVIYANVTQPENTTDKVRITYTGTNIPDSFFVDIPQGSILSDKRGFEFEDGEYQYNGASRAYIEYRLNGDDRYMRSARADNWTFSATPYHANVGLKYEVNPTGFAGDQYLVIGNYSSYSTTIGCHEISVVVSNSADSISPQEVLMSLEHSARNFNVGHRFKNVRIFVIPGRPDPSVYGKSAGNEAWVTSQEVNNINTPSMAIHEYIHTRQAFDAAGIAGMLWFTEGSASYFQYKYSQELGLMSNREYNARLKNGSELKAKLGNRSTWPTELTKYSRGFAYVAILDEKMRRATNGSYNVEGLIRDINNESKNVIIQKRHFVDRIRKNTNSEVAQWANRSVSSEATFNYSIAEIDVGTSGVPLIGSILTQLKQRIRDDPLGGFLITLLLGISIGLVLERYLPTHIGEEEEETE